MASGSQPEEKTQKRHVGKLQASQPAAPVMLAKASEGSKSQEQTSERPVSAGFASRQDHTSVAPGHSRRTEQKASMWVDYKSTYLQPLPYWQRLHKACEAMTKHQRGLWLLVPHYCAPWAQQRAAWSKPSGQPQCISGLEVAGFGL